MAARSHQIASLLQSLEGAQDVRSQYATIEAWAAQAEVALLEELAVALSADADGQYSNSWVPRAILDHLETALALAPGYAQANTLLKLSATTSAGRPSSIAPRRWLRIASMLASAQPLDVLVRLFEDLEHSEVHAERLLVLAQELVIRAIPCDQQPAIVRLLERMKAQRHPLARLPLTLLPDIEADIVDYLPRYASQSTAWSRPEKPDAQPVTQGQPTAIPRTIEEVSDRSRAQRISMCIRGWETESNGRSEVRIFKVLPSLSAGNISPAFLRSLPLAALEGADEQKLIIVPTAPSHIFSTLFAAAANGGAYTSGRYGAYGRLHTWASLAAIVANDDTWQVEAVAQQMAGCAWFDIDTTTDWFYQVAWDILLVALLPDGQHVITFAATDTD
jgi:hypothetical protein